MSIAINLDNNHYLHIRRFIPRVSKQWDDNKSDFLTQQEDLANYKVLKSTSLTGAFLSYYNLEFLIISLLEGYTIVLPDTNQPCIKTLRDYRYKNFAKLPVIYKAKESKLRDIRHEQPTAVLVYTSYSFISLETYIKVLEQKAFARLLKDFSRKIVYQTPDTFYFKGVLPRNIEQIWIDRFKLINKSVVFKDLDSTLSSLTVRD